jgi:ferredoxin--NADP+ reductase
MPLQIAIVGAGPAGLYCAERLVRDMPGHVSIDVLDKLPTPFGLIRAGVAPDHQGTKAVIRIFDRLMTRPELAFFGNVSVGDSITLAELRQIYDTVVIATGAPLDLRLGIPGEDLPGVFGSGAIVGWYNGHPDHAELAPCLERVRSILIIGHGNVAIDVARVFAKSSAEMRRSDLDPGVERAIAAAPIETIWVIGRRDAAETRFSPVELAELGHLDHAQPEVRAADLPTEPAAGTPVLEILGQFAGIGCARKPVAIRFRFGHKILRLLGRDRVAAAFFAADGEGAEIRYPADLVVTCIGHTAAGHCLLRTKNGIVPNEGGIVEDGLYVAGWAKRGPTGTIPTTRGESHAVARLILSREREEGRGGRRALEALLRRRAVDVVDWRHWQLIDGREIARAAGTDRVRRKFSTTKGMLEAAMPDFEIL